MVVVYAIGLALSAAAVGLAAPVIRAAWSWQVERRNRAVASGQARSEASETSRLDRRLAAAGLSVPGGVYLALVMLPSALLLVAGTARFSVLGGAVLAGAAVLSCELWLRNRTSARTGRFEVQLGECLPMVAEGIRGGMTFESSVRNVASYMDEPLKGQFEHLAAERAYGLSLSESVERMAKRVGSRDMDMLAAVVSVQSQSGGSMADVLDSMAETIQRRNRLRKHVEVVTADGRISAAVIGAIPVVVFVVLNIAAPGYVHMLVSEPAGWAMLGVAVVMVVIGLASIRRLYRIRIC